MAKTPKKNVLQELKVYYTTPQQTLHDPARPGDAGYDIYAMCDIHVLPFVQKPVPCGFKIEIPKGYVGIIHQKSGISKKKGLDTIGNVIDSGYRGEVHVILMNNTAEVQEFRVSERIAQLVIHPVITPKIKIVKYLSKSARGDKGFGSTGK